jgi:hypothetical protein
MRPTLSSFSLVLFATVAACGGKFDIGYDHPAGAGGATTGSAGANTSGDGSTTPGSGGGGGNDPALCSVPPASAVPYETLEELKTLLVRRWQRCLAPQLEGEDVGVEFTADGHYYPLTHDVGGNVVRREGPWYERTWAYYPAGAIHPISHQPSPHAWMDLNGVITDPPSFTEGPFQMGILFSPVPSRYIPLDP